MQKRWKAVLTLTLTTFAFSVILNLGSNSVLSYLPLTLSILLLFYYPNRRSIRCSRCGRHRRRRIALSCHGI